ncbi:hypothetical protein [Halorubrum sp. Atlit-26R]|uniref:hypothetical protein n=1 Tax=Halorubrum sp. Atlit-26R TaxID=2282128 RepID=UPI000EF25EB2|nr:hypothetical protein [Halorubrum sp. Atlit-26R]RLM59963.1 hypothetical protein DVK07_20095 [Halorubrum sp. Atlit-26R]
MTRHIDAIISTNEGSRDSPQKAKVTKNEKQGAVGVPVFFSAEDIQKQGINPDEVDEIGIRVEDGFVVFVPVNSETG